MRSADQKRPVKKKAAVLNVRMFFEAIKKVKVKTISI